jgi:DNA-directed RNA polymerase subunit beta'
MRPEYNQKYVYPDHTVPPLWVKQKMDAFHEKLRNDTQKYKSLNILKDNIKQNLEDNILNNYTIRKTLDKKEIGNIIKHYDKTIQNGKEFMWWYYLLMQAGFILSSVIPVSFEPEALMLPDKFKVDKNKAIAKYEKSKKEQTDAIQFQKDISKIAEQVKVYFKENDINIVNMMNSGAKGDVSHIQSILLSVGLSINSYGEINDVISSSHADGISQTQFFNGSSQGIQALYAKSSETAVPGYAGRKLSAIAEGIKLSATKDCGSQRFLNIYVKDDDLLKAITGRHYKSTFGLLQIKDGSNLVGKTLELRTPLYCKAKDGICEICYNSEYVQRTGIKPGANIGLRASTGLTNKLVNLTLKKSHVGVSLDEDELDLRDEFKKMK